jgi:hypothetical protein
LILDRIQYLLAIGFPFGDFSVSLILLCSSVSRTLVAVFVSFSICFKPLILCKLLQGVAGIVLESSVKKTRGFVVQIALSR